MWKRFKTVYLPYLLIVGLITVYDGGISGMTGWVSFLTGAEYWYIRNILVFYLAFYVVYRLSDRPWVRMLLMAVCLTAYSGLLIWQGRALFWYISNVTFLFGMLLAQYERQLLKAAGFLYPLQLLALAVGMYFVIKTGLEGYTVIPPLEEKIRSGLLAGLIWTYLMVQGCAFCMRKSGGWKQWAAFRWSCICAICLCFTALLMTGCRSRKTLCRLWLPSQLQLCSPG